MDSRDYEKKFTTLVKWITTVTEAERERERKKKCCDVCEKNFIFSHTHNFLIHINVYICRPFSLFLGDLFMDITTHKHIHTFIVTIGK